MEKSITYKFQLVDRTKSPHVLADSGYLRISLYSEQRSDYNNLTGEDMHIRADWGVTFSRSVLVNILRNSRLFPRMINNVLEIGSRKAITGQFKIRPENDTFSISTADDRAQYDFDYYMHYKPE